MFERYKRPESQIWNLKLGLRRPSSKTELRSPLPTCPSADLPTCLSAHLLAEKLRHEVQSFLCLR